MRLVSSLPILGLSSTLHAKIIPLNVIRSASRLSSIHQGIRRSERAGPDARFNPRREIRQKPGEEPYLSPEERQRARAIARRNPVEYKIRKGKKNITEEPGPPRKSKAARFNDPRDPFGSHSAVKKLKSGKLFEEVRDTLNNSDGPLSPEDFELQLKLDEAEDLMRRPGPQRRQHEKSAKFSKRIERKERSPPSWKTQDDPIDDFETVPRSRYQSRDTGRAERSISTAYHAKDDRSIQLDRGTRYGSREILQKSREDLRRTTSFGAREDRFEPSGSSQRFENKPRIEARSYGSENTTRDPGERRTSRREEDDSDITEFGEEGEEGEEVSTKDGAKEVRRIKTWEPPVVLPYTTAASQFLYGTSTVEAAIEANRRRMYKLYIYTGSNRRNTEKDDRIADMAQRRGIRVEYMDETGLALMNKMSGSRAHNGYVLEASPLPQTPVSSLGEVPADASRPGFHITLGYQSREEALINGTPDFIMTEPSSRKPFVLLLDQILDPGNLGAVIRTASFMGVSAIVLSKRGSAPVTPTVLKASAGAAETAIIMSTESVVDFVEASQESGWKVYAAVPPKAEASKKQVDTYDVETEDPLLESPCVLILGNEGEGLTRQLKKAADEQVSIPNMGGSKVVDSLNVSVAAGLLCQSFLRGKTRASMLPTSQGEDDDVLF